MGKVRVIVALSLISLLLALISCGSGGNAQLDIGAHPQSVTQSSGSWAAPLPLPSALRGSSAVEQDLYHSGREYGDSLPQNHVSRNSLEAVFAPHWVKSGGQFADLAYATYQFQLNKVDPDPLVHFTWTKMDSFTDGWVALANFQRDRWDWYQLPESGELPFDPAISVSVTGVMYVVALFTGETVWRLREVWVGLDGWPMYGHDAQHTNRSPYVGSQTGKLKWAFRTTGPGFDITDATVGPDGTIYVASGTELHALNPDGSIRWHSVACDPSTKPALAANGMIYIGGKRSKLYAINSDGSLNWTYAMDGLIIHTPAIAVDGTVYAQTEYDKLYAIDSDGSLKWVCTAGDHDGCTPAVTADGTVYAVDIYGLSAFNPDGSMKWTCALKRILTSPAIGADGTVYVGSDDNNVYAINPDGNLKWIYTTGNYVYSSPVIGTDGTVYVGSYDNNLYAINPDGSLKWTYATENIVHSSPAIGADGTVYAGSFDTKLYAINPDGSLKWTYATEIPLWSSPALNADGDVYIVAREDYQDPDGKLYAISTEGSLEWLYCAGGKVAASPAISADGTVYVACTDSNLYAISPDGTVKWAYATGGSFNGCISSPAVGMDGTVYVGSDDGKFYAINPDGSLKWDYTATGPVESSPVIGADGTVYVAGIDDAGGNGILYAINPDSSLKWIFPSCINWAAENSPAMDVNGTIYAASTDGNLSAINQDGSLKWTCAAANGVSSPAIGADRTIYVGSYAELYAVNPDGNLKWTYNLEAGCMCPAIGVDGSIYVVDANKYIYDINPDGSLKWSYTAVGSLYTSPAIGVDGTVYIGGGIDHSGMNYRYGDGKFYAINPDGSLKWEYTTEDIVGSSPAIGADGTVYVGSDDGKLYAFGD